VDTPGPGLRSTILEETIMKAITGWKRAALSFAVAGAFAGGASQARASAFALTEQSASGLGNSYAGAAASAEDASTIYYNPAGMSLLPEGSQISFGGVLIDISTKFSNSGSIQSGATGPVSAVPNATRPLGGTGGDAGGLSGVPNLYFATDITKDWKIGLGISAPFGLKTEYNSDWMGRFQAIKSEIDTVNFNPSVSFKLNDVASFGFGLNYQQFNADLTNGFNYVVATAGTPLGGAGAAAIPPANAEGTVEVKGSDSAWGYNLGAMFQLSPDTRLGASYRSSINYHVTGTVTFSNVPTNPPQVPGIFKNGNATLDIKMPDTFSLALAHQLDPKWTLLADATWTGWSKIQNLTVITDNGLPPSVTPENFRDTWRLGIGANYHYSDAWTIKIGTAYDQSPVNDTDRTARLPDNDRIWLSVGTQYRWSKQGTLDFGYAHLFVKDTPINQSAGNAPLNGQLVGMYTTSIDIFGAQLSYRF
jgi:long-chain fatty acid transport protein